MKFSFSNQIGVNLYCIRNAENDYWSNEIGWIKIYNEKELYPYTVFTENEKGKFNLPIGNNVHWEKI